MSAFVRKFTAWLGFWRKGTSAPAAEIAVPAEVSVEIAAVVPAAVESIEVAALAAQETLPATAIEADARIIETPATIEVVAQKVDVLEPVAEAIVPVAAAKPARSVKRFKFSARMAIVAKLGRRKRGAAKRVKGNVHSKPKPVTAGTSNVAQKKRSPHNFPVKAKKVTPKKPQVRIKLFQPVRPTAQIIKFPVRPLAAARLRKAA